jgi:hypothetical protein
MFAPQTKAHDATGSDNSRASPPRKNEKRPTNFMFIDSNNGGVNAKPDKVVRSFVMKSARNKKPWSTRPKSPKAETPMIASPRRRSSSRAHSSNGQLQGSGGPSRVECDASTVSRTVASPSSSRSNSVFSNTSSNWAAGESPVSTHTISPCAEYGYADDAFDLSNQSNEYCHAVLALKLASHGRSTA